MTPNKPDGPGWWYMAFLNKLGDPDFDWRIVLISKNTRNRLYWSDGIVFHYLETETNTYWERVLPPSWERDARAGATTDEVTT